MNKPSLRKKISDKIKKYRRYFHDKEQKAKLTNTQACIISSNCIGGIVSHNLGLRLNSPTINLYMAPGDFVKFCTKLDFYLSLTPTAWHERNGYPVLMLGDLVLHALHYGSFDEAIGAWERRKTRVDLDRVVLVMSERDGCTHQNCLDFDKLPYPKVLFTCQKYEDIQSSFYLPKTENLGKDRETNKVIDLTQRAKKLSGLRYLDAFDWAEFLNRGRLQGSKSFNQ